MAISIYIPTNSARGFPFLHTLHGFFCQHSDGSQEETDSRGDSQTLPWALDLSNPLPPSHLHSDVQWCLSLKAETSAVKSTPLPKPSPPQCSSSDSGSMLSDHSWWISFLHSLHLMCWWFILTLPPRHTWLSSFHCHNTAQTIASLTCTIEISS